jgi:hypothetical protein
MLFENETSNDGIKAFLENFIHMANIRPEQKHKTYLFKLYEYLTTVLE